MSFWGRLGEVVTRILVGIALLVCYGLVMMIIGYQVGVLDGRSEMEREIVTVEGAP